MIDEVTTFKGVKEINIDTVENLDIGMQSGNVNRFS